MYNKFEAKGLNSFFYKIYIHIYTYMSMCVPSYIILGN